MTKLWRNEPAVLTALIGAVLGVAAAFGLHLSADQSKAIMALVVIVVGIVTRSQVSPVAKLRSKR